MQHLDVTPRFRKSSLAWRAGLEATEAVGREELGSEDYEHPVGGHGCLLAGTDAGLLRGSFLGFERPM